MKTRLIVLAVLSTAGVFAQSLDFTEKTATVEIHAVDLYGRALEPIKVTTFVHQNNRGADYSAQFVAGKAKGIPYGEYSVSLGARGASINGEVSVSSSEVFAVLSRSAHFFDDGILIDSTESTPFTVSVSFLKGRVLGLPKGIAGPIWVRISNLYENTRCCTTAKVADDRSFSAPISPGVYAIAVLKDSGVLYMGAVKVEALPTQVEIDVKKSVLRILPNK